MSILRYTASADTTITNAYKSSLADTQRATGSNMGEADSLEVFSIYGQTTSSAGYSQELSRILLNFSSSVAKVIDDRSAGTIPVSGSVDFYLRMFNVKHPFTLPRKYHLTVAGVTNTWDEGIGTDMEKYADKDEANWINRNDDGVTAICTSAINTDPRNDGDNFTINVPADIGGSGNTVTIKFESTISTPSDDNTIHIHVGNDVANATTLLVSAFNGQADTDLVRYGSTAGTTSDGLAGMTATIAGPHGGDTGFDNRTLHLTASAGLDGNDVTLANGSQGSLVDNATFSGGKDKTPWDVIGGDFHTGTYASTTNLPHYKTYFEKGYEDLELDITSLVEEWMASDEDATKNYGLGVFLSASYESYNSNSSGLHTSTTLHNLEGAKRSYYTKKFSGRGTEFFFKRPLIEARWNSAIKDDRSNLHFSSSLMTGPENLNTIYLYNYVGGHLRDIPDVTSAIYVNIHSGSAANTGPYQTFPLKLVKDEVHVSDAARQVIKGGKVSTGIYSASFAINAPATSTSGPPGAGFAWAQFSLEGAANKATMSGQSFDLTDSDGNSQTFTFNVSNDSVTDDLGDMAAGSIGMLSDSNTSDIMNSIKSAINNVSALGITARTITDVGNSTSATCTSAINTDPVANGDSFTINVPTSIGGTGETITVTFQDGIGDPSSDTIHVSTGNDYANATTLLVSAFNGQSDTSKVRYGSSAGDTTNGIAGITAAIAGTNEGAAGSDNKTCNLTAAAGAGGNSVILANTTGGQSGPNDLVDSTTFSGGVDSQMLLWLDQDKYGYDGNRSIDLSGVTHLSDYTTYSFQDGSDPDLDRLFDVWYLGATQYHTGSIDTLKRFSAGSHNTSPGYVNNIKNMKAAYSRNETVRFRVTTRQKDWNPTIYTVASRDPEIQTIESASFRIFRAVDGLEAISFGTGSTLHTQLSYDASGSYFDLDMTMLESGYMYGIQLAYYDNQNWKEQEEVFKFRVE